jgi:predicted PP-loop superfamily ATPase
LPEENEVQEMQCKCGGEITRSEREIKTLAKAEEYFIDVDGTDLPLQITEKKCTACGRCAITVYNLNYKLLNRLGQFV